MNLRNQKLVAHCSNDKGARQYRYGDVKCYDSINQAKKENSLNAGTCVKFPPTVDDLHEEALAIDAENH